MKYLFEPKLISLVNGYEKELIVMLGIFVFFMYFAMWRPQSKRAKEQRNLISSLAKGDEVVTAGGVLGKVGKMGDSYVSLEISNGVEVQIQRSAVVQVLPKGTIK